MLTVGMGGQTLGMYRTQFYYWVILGTPLLLSNDIRNMEASDKNLVLNSEAISMNRDRDCVMGSLVQAAVGETWIRTYSKFCVHKHTHTYIHTYTNRTSKRWLVRCVARKPRRR